MRKNDKNTNGLKKLNVHKKRERSGYPINIRRKKKHISAVIT